jgi:hypothetical protein
MRTSFQLEIWWKFLTIASPVLFNKMIWNKEVVYTIQFPLFKNT